MRKSGKSFMPGLACLLALSAGAHAGSIFDRPFEGTEVLTAASEMNIGGSITDLPAGETGPIRITFTETGDAFDVVYEFDAVPGGGSASPGRTTASSLNGSDITWDYTFTEGGVDVSVAHFTGSLVLDEATDAYTITGTFTEEFLVDVPPPGTPTIAIADGTFTAAQAPDLTPPDPTTPPNPIPLPAGVWLGLTGLVPLVAARRRLLPGLGKPRN